MHKNSVREVWFIRHAESVANAGARTREAPTYPLSDLGFRQAAELAGPQLRQAAAEARASGGKGESGNEDNFRTGGVDGRTIGRVGFKEAERAKFQLRRGLHSVEYQVVSHDTGEEDGFRPAPIERAQIGFAGQRGKGGDSLRRLPVGQ